MQVGLYGDERTDYYATGPFLGPHMIQMTYGGPTGHPPEGEERLQAVATRIHQIHASGKRVIPRLWFYSWWDQAVQGLYLPTYNECVERIDHMMSFLNPNDVYGLCLLEEVQPIFNSAVLNSVYDYVKGAYGLPVFQFPTWWEDIDPHWGTTLKCDGYIINTRATTTQELLNYYANQPKPMKYISLSFIDYPQDRANFGANLRMLSNAGVEDLILFAIDRNGYYAWEPQCDPITRNFFNTYVLPLAPPPSPDYTLLVVAGGLAATVLIGWQVLKG